MLAEKALADEDRARRRAERQRCQCWERLVRLWLLRDTTLRRRKHRIVLAAFTSWMAWSVLSREQRRRQEQRLLRERQEQKERREREQKERQNQEREEQVRRDAQRVCAANPRDLGEGRGPGHRFRSLNHLIKAAAASIQLQRIWRGAAAWVR